MLYICMQSHSNWEKDREEDKSLFFKNRFTLLSLFARFVIIVWVPCLRLLLLCLFIKVLLQWNQSLNRCLKQDVKNNTEKNKKLFLRMTFCFIFRVEAGEAEVATKRLKSSNVFYSMTVVVQTNSFIQQEISEG